MDQALKKQVKKYAVMTVIMFIMALAVIKVNQVNKTQLVNRTAVSYTHLHVWCTGKNLFQETMGLGNMIQDIHKILTEEEPDPGQMHYIHQLR